MSFADRGETALAQQCFSNALRLQRGETALDLARADTPVIAPTPVRATVEEQVQQDQPPIVVSDERDENGNPRLPPV